MQRIGVIESRIFLFSFMFLLITAVQISYKKIKSRSLQKKENIEEMKQMEIKQRDMLKKIVDNTNNFFDELNLEDQNLILTFLKSENKAMLSFSQKENIFSMGHYMSRDIHKYIVGSQTNFRLLKDIDFDNYWLDRHLNEVYKQNPNLEVHPGTIMQYKLATDFYQKVKVVCDKNGKLGNF